MDVTNDAVSMSLARARRLINFQIERMGQVRTDVRLVDQLPTPYTGGIDGMGWFYQAAIPNTPFSTDVFFFDLLLWVSAGFLFGGKGAADPLTGLVTDINFVGGGITGYVPFACFFLGKRVRFFSLSSEIFMLQEGGLLPLRAYFSPTLGQGFYRAGIEPPVASNLTLTAAGTGLTGTWGYKITFADERFRESSPSPEVDITLTNEATHVVASNIGTYSPPTSYGGSNLRYAYLYRNTIAAPDVFYRIAFATLPMTNLATYTFKAGDFFYDAVATNDTAPDAAITGNAIAPAPGENDPPLPASIGCIHKNRVFLNSTANANTLQVSNAGSPVQFAALFNIDTPTDGGRFEIGSDQGNIITALVEFGSVLAIFKRRGSYFLYGDSLADFIVRPVHQRGCIAPDSAVRCDNIVCFLSDDGVYAASYEAGDVVTKISKEIEREILSAPVEQRENAVAWFVDRRYHLAINDIIYVYDLDAEAWTCYVFGSGPLSVIPGVPDAIVTAKIGFGNLGNSGLYGSVVPNSNCDEGGQEPPPLCGTDVTPTSLSFPGDGGTTTLSVVPQNATITSYASYAPWLGINGPQFGPGTATVSCEPNNTCFDRTGAVQVCQQLVTVTQDRSSDSSECPCEMDSLTPDEFNVDHTAQTVQTAYVEHAAATITYMADVAWLHPQAPIPSTSTTGTMDIDVDANTTCADRTGHVQICDKFVTVNQAPDPGCGCSVVLVPDHISVVSPGDASGSFDVVASNDSINSPVSADQSWVHIVDAPVSGSGVVSWTIDPNPDICNTRVGHITICNAVYTITQTRNPDCP